jgi:hypothetical protein
VALSRFSLGLGGNLRAERNFSLSNENRLKGRFPLGGIFRAERNFPLSVISQVELIRKDKEKFRSAGAFSRRNANYFASFF